MARQGGRRSAATSGAFARAASRAAGLVRAAVASVFPPATRRRTPEATAVRFWGVRPLIPALPYEFVGGSHDGEVVRLPEAFGARDGIVIEKRLARPDGTRRRTARREAYALGPDGKFRFEADAPDPAQHS